MLDISTLVSFISVSLALLLLPGPSVAYVVTRCVSQGRWAGFVSVLGISLGAVVHTIAAAIGISAIIYASSQAFFVFKIIA